jgi:hypothetical protein
VDVEEPGGGSWNVTNWGDSGLHNNVAGCSASEAYASGPASVNAEVKGVTYLHQDTLLSVSRTYFRYVNIKDMGN